MANGFEIHHDHVALKLSGELTFANYQEFQSLMQSAKDSGKSRCVIDLSELDAIDSAGIGLLLFANDETRQTNMGLTIRGPRGPVLSVLEHTHIQDVIPFEA